MNKIKLELPKIDEILLDIPDGCSLAQEDQAIVCAIAKQSKKILEIGTFRGRTTVNLAKFSQKDAIIYTIDKEDRANSALFQYEFSNKIRTIVGNALYYDFVRKGICDLDFVFVDGDHAKTSVYADTRIALQLIKRDGVIVWHDFAMNDSVGEYAFDYFIECSIQPKILSRDLGYFSFETEIEM